MTNTCRHFVPEAQSHVLSLIFHHPCQNFIENLEDFRLLVCSTVFRHLFLARKSQVLPFVLEVKLK